MTEKEFFAKLDAYYWKVPRTNFCCKFYAQAGTFSFELHRREFTCFTKESLFYESEIYDFWIGSSKTMKKIISDINKKAKEFEQKLKTHGDDLLKELKICGTTE